ncbi:MAG: cell division protein ZapA [Rickettsiales bacterium]|nr:cell division protein ZapA [Rickettsiales bacterium]
MSIVEIKIGKSKYKIECEFSEKERILKLSENLNKRFNDISSSIKNADEKTILVILALMLKAELAEKNHNELSEEDYNSKEEELFNNLNIDIENATQQINDLANKIRNY